MERAPECGEAVPAAAGTGAMRGRGLRHAGLATVWLTATLFGLVSVSDAEPYLTQLEWIHPDPEAVVRFEILYATSAETRDQATAVPVGKPLEVDRFAHAVQVPARSTVWVAVVAVGPGGARSEPSAWRRIDWAPGQGPLGLPGQPYLVDESADRSAH